MCDFEKAVKQRFLDRLNEFTDPSQAASTRAGGPKDRRQVTPTARKIIAAAAKALGENLTSEDIDALIQRTLDEASMRVPPTAAVRKAEACLHAWIDVCQYPEMPKSDQLDNLSSETEKLLKSAQTCSDPAVAAVADQIKSVFSAWCLLKDKHWPRTLRLCSSPALAKVAVRILGLQNMIDRRCVLKWINAAGEPEELRDGRAHGLITAAHTLAKTARIEMQTPRGHREHFKKWVAILSTFEGRLRKEASHQLEGRWLDRELAPALTRSIEKACSLAEGGVAEFTIKRIEPEEDIDKFIWKLLTQPAVVAQRNTKHGAGNEFIRGLSAYIEAENGKRPDHVLVSILAIALVPMADPRDHRPDTPGKITPELVESLVKPRKLRGRQK